jgi:hypothetical protein
LAYATGFSGFKNIQDVNGSSGWGRNSVVLTRVG